LEHDKLHAADIVANLNLYGGLLGSLLDATLPCLHENENHFSWRMHLLRVTVAVYFPVLTETVCASFVLCRGLTMKSKMAATRHLPLAVFADYKRV